MSDPLIRDLDHYVVLEPGCLERILTAAETLDWLAVQLAALPTPPADLANLASDRLRAERLIDTACELAIAPGETIQWFAVRLEPHRFSSATAGTLRPDPPAGPVGSEGRDAP